MNNIKVVIEGEPKGKARPRVTKAGIAYTPQETVNYENWVKLCYQTQTKKKFEREVHARIDAYFQIPKSTSKKKAELMEEKEIRPTKKPDVDNIAKIILDSLNGIAYKDDSQVVSCLVCKYYSEKPRVEVLLWEE
ncbi:MAG: phage protein [Caloramator sp.]|nr:MAG: phage protein [Caloramator sp.]